MKTLKEIIPIAESLVAQGHKQEALDMITATFRRVYAENPSIIESNLYIEFVRRNYDWLSDETYSILPFKGDEHENH